MGLQRVPLSDFSGGLNTKDGPFNLEPNEAQDLLNVVLTERGALEQRLGKTQFDTSGGGLGGVTHMRNWYPASAAKRLMLSTNAGDICSCSTTGAITLAFNGTATTVWSFEQGQDVANADTLWCMNGLDNPQKIDNTGTSVDWTNSPPNGTMLRLWKNRMCISGNPTFPQRLYYSDIANPESPAATYGTNFIDIKTTDDDLDPITWLEVIGDHLLVFKKQSVWQIYDSNSFANQRLGTPGCEGRFMSCVSEGRCYYFHRSGVWSTNGTDSPVYESEAIENFIIENLSYVAIDKVRLAASRDRRVFVALPFGSALNNNRVLELIPYLKRARREGARAANGAWTVHDYAVSSICSWRPVNVDTLLGADPTIHLYTLFTGTSDAGVAISSKWKFGWRAILGEEPRERIRRLNVEMSGECTVAVYKDFGAESFVAQLVGAVDADALWDGGQWDGGQWDAMREVNLNRARPETRGRYHAVEFRNSTLNKTFKILRAELVIRGGKEH